MPHLPRQMISPEGPVRLERSRGSARAGAPSTSLGVSGLRICALVILAGLPAFAGPAPKRAFTQWPDDPGPAPATTPDLLALGGRIYRGACVGCHGEKGDGDGREGQFLPIPPRDFTTGLFITRSTPLGSLPLDKDLFGSIRRGFRPGTGMPAFTFLSDREVWAVIAHLKSFSPRFAVEKPQPSVELPPVPARTPAMAATGQTIFMSLCACFVCHGMQGKGDGPAAPGLVYGAGKHAGKRVPPANLHRAMDFKGGGRPEDIFRSISTGLDGTPMPGFVASLSVEQRWQLVAFILSLQQPSSKGAVP